MTSPIDESQHPTRRLRSYNGRRRREAAEESRLRVLARARELFLSAGYAATTIATIAQAAGVSPESVYKGFGGKPGLVRAIQEQSLLGAGGAPAEERSDRAQEVATDGRELMQRFGRFVTEIAPLGAPIILLIRDAAASGDADMNALLREVEGAQYRRMLHNARRVVARGLLRPGLSAEEAADVMVASTSVGLYESLVLKRGWSAEKYGRFVARMLVANLLPDQD